ncbi:Ig-like domain-containing protein [Alteromonas sp. SM 2104]|nr:Ig-like domain-containing protein [Alteromonas oceanisediminis]
MLPSVVRSFLFICTLFLVSACGGGGGITDGSNGGGGTPNPPPTTVLSLSVSLVDANGQPASDLSAESSLTARASVTDQDGNAVEGELINFSFTPEGLAAFNNDSGTAVTGSDGVASIGITVGDDSGGGVVVASLGDLTAQAGFTSSGTVVEQDLPASLQLFADSPQLSSSGSDEIELTAIVKNDRNVLLEGVTVDFSANAGAAVMRSQPVTDVDGVARATLRTGGNRQNRTIIATAEITDGVFLQETVDVAVVGTEITVNSASSVIIDDTVDVTIRLEDSDNQGINAQTVTVSAFNSAGTDVTADVLSTTSVLTDVGGGATLQFSSSTSGTYTVVASALNAQETFDIAVQQDQFTFVNPPDISDVNDDIPLNSDFTLTVRWLIDSVPFAGGNIDFATSRGTIVSASTDTSTDANGQADVTIRSTSAGQADIIATGTDAQNRQVSARLKVAFIATQANAIYVNATPDAIGPDGQTATISAVVRDPVGNLVRNKLINFNVDDVSNGNLTSPQGRTDRRGIATTVYESNAVSGSEMVIVTATVDDTPSVFSSTELTVGDRPFDISIGTGNLIRNDDDSTYTKEFSAFVTDPDSNPIANTALTFRAPPNPTANDGVYRKGTWRWVDDPGIWVPVVNAICPNEDVNGNGILDPEDVDTNGDGMLTPGNVVSITESAATDENGQAMAFVRYARQFGFWTEVLIEASGESAGSESSENMYWRLVVAADDLQDEASPPPDSPYGVSTSCSDTL